MQLNLFRIAYPVTTLGPSKRVVIWVAGCRKRCKGCISPEMQSPASGNLIDTGILAHHIVTLAHPIDGITISGGEPFDQAEALAELIEMVKLRKPEWNVMVYTGYLLRTVRKKSECRSLLEKVDILIDGPYREEIPSRHPWVGSGNQKVNMLNRFYKKQNFNQAKLHNESASLGISNDNDDLLIGVLEYGNRLLVHSYLFNNGAVKD
jgi:anaerobic ribonucleoside-triphosphate reductase activating protein